MTSAGGAASALLALALGAPSPASEAVDLDAVTRIRQEGFERSQVVATAAYLCDVIGPRLTASPSARRANDWTRERFEAWGLEKAHLEGSPFGVGWSFESASVRMVAPLPVPLRALPKAWTPGTPGTVRAPAVKAVLKAERDFEAVRGRLRGKVVLLADARKIGAGDGPVLQRFSSEELAELRGFPVPRLEDREAERQAALARARFRRALNGFLAEEGVVAALEPSTRDEVLVVKDQGSYETDGPRGVPTFVVLPEHYNRLVRLLERGLDVELEVSLAAAFHEEDTNAYATLAEIPGADKREEVVMAGAHLDSWHGGTGATDNAAGVAIVMEAARILKAAGLAPRRTIRFALWTGEEQTYAASEAYVSRHLGGWTGPRDPEERALDYRLQNDRGRLELKPDHARFSVYFNVDNGGGRIRGIYAQESSAAAALFEEWMRPLADLGVTTVTARDADDTDHEVFDDVGLPAFQFIQDDLEYTRLTWHSDVDTYDHLVREDLMQASVVLATFLYQAAARDGLLPRKPLPQYP
jgi:hypothetical protein